MHRPPVVVVVRGLALTLTSLVLLGAAQCPVGCRPAKATADGGRPGLAAPSPAGMAAAGELVVIPGAGHLAGAGGSVWRTDLAIRNAAADPAEVEVALLRRGQANPDPATRSWTIDPGASLHVEDVLAAAFGADGAAALAVTTLRGRVVAASRTYNLGGGGATYGQLVPALGAADSVVAGDEGWLDGLAHDPGGVDGFRTNLLLVNGSATTTMVAVRLLDGVAGELGTVEVTLEPGEAAQLNNVFERVTGAPVTAGRAVVTVTTPGGRVWALASVVDNRSGDPVAVAPILASVEDDPSSPLRPTMVFAGAARLAGAAGTDWRTNLVLTNHQPSATTAVVELLPRSGGDPVSQTVVVPGGGSVAYADVLGELFGVEGAGTLRVSRYGAVTAAARTYNLLGAGNPQGLPSGATFGQSLPVTAFNRTLPGGQTAWIPLLDQATDLSAGRRTNLLLADVGIYPMTVTIELFDATGELLGTLEQSLEARQSVQLDRVFQRVTAQPVAGGSIAVRHDAYGGLVALASVVDNLTGDPASIPAIFAPPPATAGAVETAVELVGVLGADDGELLGTVLEAAAGDSLVAALDDLALFNPGLVSATDEGTRIELGGAATGAGGRVASGAVTIAVTAAGPGAGSMRLGLDDLVFDGLSSAFGTVAASYQASPVDGGVAATVELAAPAAKADGPQLHGELELDTSVCGDAPTGGELTVTDGEDEYRLTFDPPCGDHLRIQPRPSPLVFSFTHRTCGGDWSPVQQEIRLVRFGTVVIVDPSATPSGQVGRDRWRVVGVADDLQGAVLRIVRLRPDGSADLTAWFRGAPTRRDDLVYWTGTILITVEPDGCDRTWYHGPDDIEAWKVLQNCPDGC